ncbi:hypothetical protein OYT88_11785 [Sporolactobacillus sp. CQH2019]|uniref:hypothetical protein n=1 Tax=Sporolactobacillus sp. CQH2019 TaxID=3023512 RepID=UPI002367A9CB|nr:hypothetical protein [Sporolactobacillus sp. CQH2019]MDD9149234.1 hypothetical protein [Sporolactobacillus sp. CQH2019]
MIPVYEAIKIGETKTADRTIPTSDELSRLFIACVFAEQDFIREKRPDLAKRASAKAKIFSDMSVSTRCKENGWPVPSTKLADFIFQSSYKRIVSEYFTAVSIAH